MSVPHRLVSAPGSPLAELGDGACWESLASCGVGEFEVVFWENWENLEFWGG